jgi:hypothetical protein
MNRNNATFNCIFSLIIFIINLGEIDGRHYINKNYAIL